jgi:hypothetical protein
MVPVRGNLITSNQKLRTTGFVVWQSSLGSAGCQPAIVVQLADEILFWGSARVSRVGFGVSPKQSFREVRDREDVIANTETHALPRITVTARFFARSHNLLRQHQFGPAAPQDIIHLIEGVPDHHQTETTWSDNLITSPSAMQRFYWRLHAIVPKSHPHTIVSDLEREGDQFIVTQFVSVSNNIRARFIHTQHHQRAIALRDGHIVEKMAHKIAHQREVAGMAGKLELPLFHFRPHHAGESYHGFKFRS